MALLDRFPEALAFQELHDDERPPLIFAEIINADNVLVRDIGSHSSLQEKACLGLRVHRTQGGENFQGNVPAENAIFGAVYMSHSAAQEFLELVFSDSGRMIHQRVTGIFSVALSPPLYRL